MMKHSICLFAFVSTASALRIKANETNTEVYLASVNALKLAVIKNTPSTMSPDVARVVNLGVKVSQDARVLAAATAIDFSDQEIQNFTRDLTKGDAPALFEAFAGQHDDLQLAVIHALRQYPKESQHAASFMQSSRQWGVGLEVKLYLFVIGSCIQATIATNGAFPYMALFGMFVNTVIAFLICLTLEHGNGHTWCSDVGVDHLSKEMHHAIVNMFPAEMAVAVLTDKMVHASPIAHSYGPLHKAIVKLMH